jgi:hypothetical protein
VGELTQEARTDDDGRACAGGVGVTHGGACAGNCGGGSICAARDSQRRGS